jgi:hypothetical protein
VAKRNANHLDRKIDQISDQLPESAGAFLRWLRTPSSRWVRVPLALLLIVGGVVGFLPVLGFWMIPLGLLLLAQDVPFLQGPILRLLTWLERKWIKWRGQFSPWWSRNLKWKRGALAIAPIWAEKIRRQRPQQCGTTQERRSC